MGPKEFEDMYLLEDRQWWFKAKRELVLKMFDRYGRKEGVLLDVGCGTGINLNAFGQMTRVIGCDYSKEALKFTRKRGNYHLVRADARNLPFKNNSFDSVTALDLLEHVDDDEKAIKNIYRVLNRHGILIITVPANKFMWTNHDVISDHKRRYSQNEIKSKLQKCGFKIEKISYWNSILFLFTLLYKFLNKKSHVQPAPKPINFVLFKLMQLDNFLVEKTKLPFGVSILCVARKV